MVCNTHALKLTHGYQVTAHQTCQINTHEVEQEVEIETKVANLEIKDKLELLELLALLEIPETQEMGQMR
jgi:hypothetical protein